MCSARQNGDYDRIAALDRNFHETIAALSHNPLMITSMAAIAETCETETRESFSNLSAISDTIDRMISMHQAILTAIRNRCPGEAMTDMLEHIAGVSESLP